MQTETPLPPRRKTKIQFDWSKVRSFKVRTVSDRIYALNSAKKLGIEVASRRVKGGFQVWWRV